MACWANRHTTSPARWRASGVATARNSFHDSPSTHSVVSTAVPLCSGTSTGRCTNGCPANRRVNSSMLAASSR